MNLPTLGKVISTKRNSAGLSSYVAAKRLGKSATYYSRVENGKIRPSRELLTSIGQLFKVPAEDQRLMEQLAGYLEGHGTDSRNKEVVNNQPLMSVKLDPEKLKILFSDGVYITISEDGIVFDFGQKVASTNETMIVSRVGVSYRQAVKIHQLLGQQLNRAKEMGIEN